jgi:hypothetical protein
LNTWSREVQPPIFNPSDYNDAMMTSHQSEKERQTLGFQKRQKYFKSTSFIVGDRK